MIDDTLYPPCPKDGWVDYHGMHYHESEEPEQCRHYCPGRDCPWAPHRTDDVLLGRMSPNEQKAWHLGREQAEAEYANAMTDPFPNPLRMLDIFELHAEITGQAYLDINEPDDRELLQSLAVAHIDGYLYTFDQLNTVRSPDNPPERDTP
jgi:hypothetical protein